MSDPWVAPDTQAAAPPIAAPVARPTTPTPVAAGAPPALRPLRVPDILDGALRIWKSAPATMAGLAAVFVVPGQVLLGFLTRDALEDVDIGTSFAEGLASTGSDDLETGVGGNLFLLSVVIEGVALALVTAAVARFVAGWYTGERMTFGPLAAGALRRGWALAAAWVLVHLVEFGFAIALVLPALVPMTWYAVVTPVIACEHVGPWRALGRSFALCKRRFGAVLGVCLLSAVVDLFLLSALTAVGSIYLQLDLPAGWLVNTAVAAGGLLVTTPFVAGVATLLYLDLRVRTEGLDIELAAGRRFGAVR
jgi:hypothetical protein